MSFYFHAVAIDYDGTLSEQPRASNEVLRAVRAVRDTGRFCILVTGRILDELRADFADVGEHFDAIVGENGAVLTLRGEAEHSIAPPVPRELTRELRARGVSLREGRVLLATYTTYDDVIYDAVRRLGLDCQMVRNRSALMILPPGVTKGSGVAEALDRLNLSPHNAIAIGDAENDYALFDSCEIGVAVGNAIEPLKRHADVVLPEPNGTGVARFLHGPLLEGVRGIEPRRHQITLGTFEDDTPAMIPAARVNLALYGPSGSGKSFVAGMLAEQLVALRYTVCILDLEGDHITLGDMHGVIALGGTDALPPVSEVASLLTQGIRSVVVDLSLQSDDVKHAYGTELMATLHESRIRTGHPHWIFIDEAHVPLHANGAGWWCGDSDETGVCVITYRPELICAHVRARADVTITLNADREAFVMREGWPTPRRFFPLDRAVGHLRHLHKYRAGRLPRERHFVFRDARQPVGEVAGNLAEFVTALSRVPDGVLRHHSAHADFSRWVGDLCRDPAITLAVSDLEHAIAHARPDATLSQFRRRLGAAIAVPAGVA